jgi:hypothetical protein
MLTIVDGCQVTLTRIKQSEVDEEGRRSAKLPCETEEVRFDEAVCAKVFVLSW